MEALHKACCFSGHRIEKLTCSIEILETALREAINQAIADGFDIFYHGGCTGVDLIAAEQVLFRRFVVKQDDPKHIKLIGVLPFEEQAKYWNKHWRERYYNVLGKCDDVITLYTRYEPGCYQERNRYMVDMCQRLIAVYDGVSNGGAKNTISYAQEQGIDVQIVPL